MDDNGHDISGKLIEGCSKIKLKWEVTSDDGFPPQIKILESGSISITGLAPSGELDYQLPQILSSTLTLTLQASNTCGMASRIVTVNVYHALKLSTKLLTLKTNQSESLEISTSCKVDHDTQVTLTSSNNSLVTAPTNVTIQQVFLRCK